MKRALAFVLAICLLAPAQLALASDSGRERAVIGADLSGEQVDYVYSVFGVERGSVRELRT